MSYLIDTCVISELLKSKPRKSVVDWLGACPDDSIFLSVLTLGELYKGIAKLPESRRKRALCSWVENDLRNRFADRILAVDEDAARIWGEMQGQAEAVGKRMPAIDSLIAATAVAHGLTVVTRNAPDIAVSGVSIFDPWDL